MVSSKTKSVKADNRNIVKIISGGGGIDVGISRSRRTT